MTKKLLKLAARRMTPALAVTITLLQRTGCPGLGCGDLRGGASRTRRQPEWAYERGDAVFGVQPNPSRGAKPNPGHPVRVYTECSDHLCIYKRITSLLPRLFIDLPTDPISHDQNVSRRHGVLIVTVIRRIPINR